MSLPKFSIGQKVVFRCSVGWVESIQPYRDTWYYKIQVDLMGHDVFLIWDEFGRCFKQPFAIYGVFEFALSSVLTDEIFSENQSSPAVG